MVATIVAIGGVLSTSASTAAGRTFGVTLTLLIAGGLYRLARTPVGNLPISLRWVRVFGPLAGWAMFARGFTEYVEAHSGHALVSADWLSIELGQGLTLLFVAQIGVSFALLAAKRASDLAATLFFVAPLPALLYIPVATCLHLPDSAPHTLAAVSFAVVLLLLPLLTCLVRRIHPQPFPGLGDR